jgi:hypothetical protein
MMSYLVDIDKTWSTPLPLLKLTTAEKNMILLKLGLRKVDEIFFRCLSQSILIKQPLSAGISVTEIVKLSRQDKMLSSQNEKIQTIENWPKNSPPLELFFVQINTTPLVLMSSRFFLAAKSPPGSAAPKKTKSPASPMRGQKWALLP